jgi:hypothetical protein
VDRSLQLQHLARVESHSAKRIDRTQYAYRQVFRLDAFEACFDERLPYALHRRHRRQTPVRAHGADDGFVGVWCREHVEACETTAAAEQLVDVLQVGGLVERMAHAFEVQDRVERPAREGRRREVHLAERRQMIEPRFSRQLLGDRHLLGCNGDSDDFGAAMSCEP